MPPITFFGFTTFFSPRYFVTKLPPRLKPTAMMCVLGYFLTKLATIAWKSSVCPGRRNKEKKKIRKRTPQIPCGGRTHGLRIRSPTRFPLRQRDCYVTLNRTRSYSIKTQGFQRAKQPLSQTLRSNVCVLSLPMFILDFGSVCQL